MKKYLTIKNLGASLLAMSAMIAMSCSKDNGNQQQSVARCDSRVSVGNCAGQTPVASPSTFSDITLGGIFTGNDPTTFQNYASILVDENIPSNYLGAVDYQAQNGTGIVFGAKVTVGNTARFVPLQSNGTITTSSRLKIAVYDSYVGQIDPATGQPALPITIAMSTASGSVSGNTVNVLFNDSFGSIQFQGTMDSQNITGTVNFTNNGSVSGGTGTTMSGANSGTFQFQVPVCSFFSC